MDVGQKPQLRVLRTDRYDAKDSCGEQGLIRRLADPHLWSLPFPTGAVSAVTGSKHERAFGRGCGAGGAGPAPNTERMQCDERAPFAVPVPATPTALSPASFVKRIVRVTSSVILKLTDL